MTTFANQTKYTLTSPIQITDLGIVSATFQFIKPSNETGTFVATLDTDNDQITYDTGAGDIDEHGEWSIWATYTDSNGRFTRARTTKHTFHNDNI